MPSRCAVVRSAPGTDILELIGERLFLAENTVKNYISNIFTKLGMSRRSRPTHND